MSQENEKLPRCPVCGRVCPDCTSSDGQLDSLSDDKKKLAEMLLIRFGKTPKNVSAVVRLFAAHRYDELTAAFRSFMSSGAAARGTANVSYFAAILRNIVAKDVSRYLPAIPPERGGRS